MRRGLVGGALLLLAGLGLPRAWPLLLALPIHFHALLSLPFGLLCWAVNVHVLGLAGIDVPLLGFPPTPPATLYLVVLAVSSVVALGVAWYGLTHWEFVPTVAYAVLIGGLLWPGTLWKDERSRFIGSLARILNPSLRKEVPFSDVILADILTSFSRILGDLHATFCDLVLVPSREVLGELNRLTPRMAMDETVETATTRLSGRQGSSPSVANKAGLRAPVVLSEGPGAESFWGFQDMFGPLVISLPFLIRFRQCISEFLLAPTWPVKKRHLANAVKYLSSLPVIVMGTVVTYLQRKIRTHNIPEDEIEEIAQAVDRAVFLWILFSVINALYSLFWDIRIDWSLGHLRTNGPRRLRYPFLRPTLHFPSPYLYYLAILLDGAIRFAWFFRVYPLAIAMRAELRDPKHVHDTGGLAGVDLALKVLEVLRRWMWTFFRIEREWVEKPFYTPPPDPHRLSEKDRASGEEGLDDEYPLERRLPSEGERKTRRISWGEREYMDGVVR